MWDESAIKRVQKYKHALQTVKPTSCCCFCGKILYPSAVFWVYDCPEESQSAVPLIPLGSNISISERNGAVSSCKECKERFKKKVALNLFDNYGVIPKPILDLKTYADYRRLSIGSLFCSTFKPPGYTYTHMKGNLSYNVTTEGIKGMIGVLQDPVDAAEPIPSLDAVRVALRWLRGNNHLYKTFLATLETIKGYFRPLTAGSSFPNLPVKTPDMNITHGGQLSIGEIKKSTGLLFPADNTIIPPSHLNNVDDVSAGEQILRDTGETQLSNFAQKQKITYSDPHLEAKLFPHLFPYGLGSWSKQRDSLTLGQYHKLKLLHVDRRWAQDKYYMFFAFDRSMKVRIFNHPKMSFASNANRAHPLVAGEVASSHSDYMHYGHCIPATVTGSKSYWKSKWLDLVAMVGHLGPAHLFVTLTANDAWPELKDILSSHESPQSILHPVDTTSYFFQRFSTLKPLLFGTSKQESVFGKVSDFWYRVEAQNRGALHIHSLIWLEDKAKLPENAVLAQLPCDSDPLSIAIAELVQKLQIHNCRPNRCFRTWKGLPTTTCKYGFPYALRSADGYDASGVRFEYKRVQKVDQNIVPYNPYLLLAWGAHINVQRVTRSGLERYLVKYVAKVEPTFGLSVVSQDEVKSYLETRLIGSPECVAYLTSDHIVESTRSTVFIDTSLPQKRSRALKPFQELKSDSAGNSDIFIPGAREHYFHRPDHSLFETMVFPTFMSEYEIFVNPRRPIPKSRADFVYTDRDGLRVVRRNCKLIPRHRFLTPLDGEEFYYQQLLLKIPLRSEDDILSSDNLAGTYKAECYIRDLFKQQDDLDVAFSDMKAKNFDPNQIAKIARQLLIAQISDKATIAAKIRGLELGEEVPFGDDNSCPDELSPYPSVPVSEPPVDEYTSDVLKMLKTNRKEIVNEQLLLEQRIGLLTSSQSIVFNHVSTHIGSQLLLFITGPGGTGKSFLLHTLESHFDFSGQVVEVLATSGSAALLVNGQTVHSFFRLNPQLETSLQYRDQFWEAIAFTDVVIIDEVSMMTAEILETVESWCRLTAQGNKSTLPFGGKSVILFGDLYQLPAVTNAISPGRQIYQSVHRSKFKPFFLQENCRQIGDPLYAGLLSRLRVGTISQEDMQLLQSRLCGIGHIKDQDCMNVSDSMILCSKHELRQEYNSKIQDTLLSQNKLHCFIAHDYDAGGQPLGEDASIILDGEKGIMPKVLQIKLGAKVMITRNLDVQGKVVNGTMGLLHAVHNKVLFIRRIDSKELIPITKVKQKMTLVTTGQVVYRVQYPIILSYACTNHRVQGTTLQKVHVCLDDTFFAAGQAYVALSRVKSLAGLHLLSFNHCAFITDPSVSQIMEHAMTHGTLIHKPSVCSKHKHEKQIHLPQPYKKQKLIVPSATNMSDGKLKSEEVMCQLQHIISDSKAVLRHLNRKLFLSSPNTTEIDMILDRYRAALTQISNKLRQLNRPPFPASGPTDNSVARQLHPAFLQHYAPLHTTGDGNCLWHMISLNLCGSEKLTLVLRLLTLHVLCLNKDHFLQLISLEPPQDYDTPELFYNKLLCDARFWSSWGNEYHIYAMCIALRCPAYIYSSFWGPNSTDFTSLSDVGLLQLFNQRHQYIRRHLLFQPPLELCPEPRYPPICGFFTNGHYTALLPRLQNPLQFIPITTLT